MKCNLFSNPYWECYIYPNCGGCVGCTESSNECIFHPNVTCYDSDIKFSKDYCKGCAESNQDTNPGTKWSEIKQRGSGHYKKDPSKVEPIDLYKDGGMLRDFALGCIIKYAYRNRRDQIGKPINQIDMEKIKHYCDMLMVAEK